MTKRDEALRYAVRLPVVLKYFGQLCLVVAVLTVVPLGVALLFQEFGIAFRYGVVLSVLLSLVWLLRRLPSPSHIQVNEAMVLVAFMFFFTPLLMSYPMMGTGLDFGDALFEAISGATTTGLSTAGSVEHRSDTFLFARAWMQWYGGLGIVVFTLALVVGPGIAAKGLAVTEAGPEDLVGGTRAYARIVLVVYVVLTLASTTVIWVTGAKPFDAVVYALAAVSTGGYAPHDNSLAGLGGWTCRAAVLCGCLGGAVTLSWYYRVYRGRWRRSLDLLQLRTLLVLGVVATGLVILAMRQGGMAWPEALVQGPFLGLSAQTTAGFATMEVRELNPLCKLVLMGSMMVGGGLGSTAGGFKLLRLLILIRVLGLFVTRAGTATRAVIQPRLAGRRLSDNDIQDGLLIICLFVAVIGLSWLPFAFLGYPPLDSLFEVVSATGTVGLSAGISRPELPDVLKGVLCADMLMGRLEILAWVVFIAPRTWIGRRLHQS